MPIRPPDVSGADPVALIVDKDDDSRLLYADFLALNQWRVIGAAGGPEALAVAIAQRPDVVVTETRLPGFDGTALADLLSRDYSTAHIPIIFVTSDATPASLSKASSSGAYAVLTNPCLPETLLTAIQAAFVHGKELRGRSTAGLAQARARLDRARQTVERAQRRSREVSLKKALLRGDTVVPPITPPVLRCPLCDRGLTYVRSHLGGVSVKHLEQWDYFECTRGCGAFEYRSRTKRIRRVAG